MTENNVIGCCGICCSECPAFKAFATDEQALREKAAKEWSAMFNADIKPEDINCTGCADTEGIKFRHCFECEIRKCSHARGHDNCALCENYGCEKVKGLHGMVPEAKEALDAIRNK